MRLVLQGSVFFDILCDNIIRPFALEFQLCDVHLHAVHLPFYILYGIGERLKFHRVDLRLQFLTREFQRFEFRAECLLFRLQHFNQILPADRASLILAFAAAATNTYTR